MQTYAIIFAAASWILAPALFNPTFEYNPGQIDSYAAIAEFTLADASAVRMRKIDEWRAVRTWISNAYLAGQRCAC